MYRLLWLYSLSHTSCEHYFFVIIQILFHVSSPIFQYTISTHNDAVHFFGFSFGLIHYSAFSAAKAM